MKYLEYKIRDSRENLYKIVMLLIWGIFFYSTIIQYKYIEIPNAMFIIGATILLFFLLCINGEPFSMNALFSTECVWMIGFMVYMLTIVQVSAIHPLNHLKMCITSAEYLFILLVIVYIVSRSGTDSIQLLLIVTAIVLGVILLKSPVLYTTGRYSISRSLNPNYVGMCFTAGIWSILYFQQKKKVPVVIALMLTAFLEYCALLTGSRKALIASGIVFFLWIIFCYFSSLDNTTIGKRIIYFALVVSIVIILYIWLESEYSNSLIAQRMARLKNEVTVGERAQLYITGWNLFKKNPIFGIGFTGLTGLIGEDSHATIVEIPVSGGIIGTFIYFVSYIISIRKCLILLNICKNSAKFRDYLNDIRMLLILWVAMIFYSTCIIHPFQFLSHVTFGIIFGKSENLSKRIAEVAIKKDDMRSNGRHAQSIYIKD